MAEACRHRAERWKPLLHPSHEGVKLGVEVPTQHRRQGCETTIPEHGPLPRVETGSEVLQLNASLCARRRHVMSL